MREYPRDLSGLVSLSDLGRSVIVSFPLSVCPFLGEVKMRPLQFTGLLCPDQSIS